MNSLQFDGNYDRVSELWVAPATGVSGEKKDTSQTTLSEFRRLVRSRLNECSTVKELTSQIANVLTERDSCLAVWIDSPRTINDELPDIEFDHRLEIHKQHVFDLANQLCNAARKTGSATMEPVENVDTTFLTCVAIDDNSKSSDVVCLLTNPSVQPDSSWLDIANVIADQVSIWKNDRIRSTISAQTRHIVDTLNLTQSICQAGRVDTAARAMANHLRLMFRADSVAVGLFPATGNALPTGELKLTAISDLETIDNSSDLVLTAELSCRAAANSETTITHSSEAQDSNFPSPLKQFAKTIPSQSVIGCALRTGKGTVIGSVVIAHSNSEQQASIEQSLRRICPLVADQLLRTIEATRNPIQQAAAYVRKLVRDSKTRIAFALLSLFALMMCVPMPYNVNCDCEIQPVTRRYVPAPYDGILDSCLVKPGDVVKSNQVLATIDGQKLRIEKAALQAELSRELKKRDSALADNDIAKSQIASYEIDRLNSQMKSLESKLANLKIRSPIDGIVVIGDLAKVEGAPLEVGRELFEIAPLDEMLVEVAIPESEIRFVRQSMSVDLKLQAFPNRNWTATVQRISPTTEIIDEQSVFIAEVRLPNKSNLLRPGMKGRAAINAHWSPLGWNLFHSWWDNVRSWAIW